MQIAINDEYSIEESVFYDSDKVVIFSPYTSETVLCDRIVLDFLMRLKQSAVITLSEPVNFEKELNREVIEKLMSMRIILLKE